MKRGLSKKLFVLSILSLLLLSFLTTTIIAADAKEVGETVAKGFKETGVFIQSFLEPFFGKQELLTRVFFAILLFMIIYSIVAQISDNKWTINIVSFSITAISLSVIPSALLLSLRTSYGAMGTAILAVIPFIILLVFSAKTGSLLIARILWAFFAIYYLVLNFYIIFTTEAEFWSAQTIPYWIAIVLGILIFIFIKSLREVFWKGKMGALMESGTKIAKRGGILHKLQGEELTSSYGAGASDSGAT